MSKLQNNGNDKFTPKWENEHISGPGYWDWFEASKFLNEFSEKLASNRILSHLRKLWSATGFHYDGFSTCVTSVWFGVIAMLLISTIHGTDNWLVGQCGPQGAVIYCQYGPHGAVIYCQYWPHGAVIYCQYGPDGAVIYCQYGPDGAVIYCQYGPHGAVIYYQYGPHGAVIYYQYGPQVTLRNESQQR